MINDLQLNSTGDLDIVDYDLVLVNGADRVKQQLWMKLRLFTGDWFLNVNDGIPYYENVLIHNPDPVSVQAIFKAAILSVPNVNKLLSFELEFDRSSRSMTLDFKVDTSYGIVEIDGVL